jgi:peroxiredoxin Q/BCP
MGEFQKKDIVILGISPDSEASHQKFIAENDLPFTLLCDPGKKVMTQYEAFGEKKI